MAAGIVDQAVDRPVLGDQLSDQLFYRVFVTDVAGVPVRAATVFGDFGGDFCSFSGLRPTSSTLAPSAASSWAVQRPMPLPPPVTMRVWPLNRSALKIDA
jgi:hypothetical protein